MPASAVVAATYTITGDIHHHIGIDVDPLRLWKVGARQRRQGLHAGVSEQKARTATHSGDDHALGKNVPSDPPARRAKRRHHRDLTAARKRTGQHEVRHIRARDQENQADGHQQSLKRRRPPARDAPLSVSDWRNPIPVAGAPARSSGQRRSSWRRCWGSSAVSSGCSGGDKHGSPHWSHGAWTRGFFVSVARTGPRAYLVFGKRLFTDCSLIV